MVTNPQQLEEFEITFRQREDLPLEKKFAILEGMYHLARNLGQFTPDRSLEGIEHDIRLAASLHALVRTTPR